MPHVKPEGKPVKLHLDSETHAKLRVIAADEGVPMSQWVKRLVTHAVNAKKKIKNFPSKG